MAAKKTKKTPKGKPGRKRAGPPRLLKPSKRLPGAACKRMRERSGMNQRQLADKIGYTQPHISNIERGAIAPSEELVDAYKKVCSGKKVTKKAAPAKAKKKPVAKKRKPAKVVKAKSKPKAAKKPRAAKKKTAAPATESAPVASEQAAE